MNTGTIKQFLSAAQSILVQKYISVSTSKAMGKILQNRSNAFKCAQVQILEVSNNGRCRYLVFPTDSRSVGCCSTFTATHPERRKLGSMKTLETLKVSAEGNLPLRHEYLEVMLMCRFTVCLKLSSHP